MSAPTIRDDTRKANQCASARPSVIPQISPITVVCASALSGITIEEAIRQIATYRAMVNASLRSSHLCSLTPVNGAAGPSAMAPSSHAGLCPATNQLKTDRVVHAHAAVRADLVTSDRVARASRGSVVLKGRVDLRDVDPARSRLEQLA